ncbi:MAG: Rhomboid family [Bacteroidota bacterium]|jgi:membrane associated rhomboid family serine protease
MMIRRLYRNAPLLSQGLLLLVTMGFLSNVVAHNIAFDRLSLPASTIVSSNEWWRLVMYPFSSMNSASVILLCAVLALFGPSVENTLSTRKLAAYIGALILGQGILYTAFLSQTPQPVVLSGGDSISFFLLGLFAFLMPRRVLRINDLVEIRGLFLVFVLSLTAFCVSLLTAYRDPSSYFFTGALSSAIGVAFAVMVSTRLQLKLMRFRSYTIEAEAESFADLPVETPRVKMYVRQTGVENRIEKVMEAEASSPIKIQVNREDELNRLLDKIYAEGQASLNDEERTFLEQYSRTMR